MRLTTNLASRFYVDRRRVTLVLTLSLLFLVVTCGFFIWRAVDNVRQISQLERQLGPFRSENQVSDEQYRLLLEQIAVANALIERKSFNWLLLLDHLERVVPSGVALSSIDPKIKDNKVALAGVARDFATLRRFLENLEDSDTFHDVYLLAQGEKGEDSAEVTFTISCSIDYRRL